MNVYQLKTPLSEEDVRRLRIRDVVYLTGGKVYVISTSQARHLFDSIDRGEPIFDLDGSAVYHSALSLSKEREIRWIGATTSIMCEPETPRLIELGARAIMGKGGMGRGTLKAMQRYGAVYLATVGGTSAVLVRCVTRVKRIVDVPGEGIFGQYSSGRLAELEVRNFGPMIVGMDAEGHSLYDDLWERASEKAAELAGARGKARLYGRFY